MEIPDFPPAPLQEKPQETFFNKFLEKGKEGKNEFWRYVLGIVIVIVGGYFLIGQVPLDIAAVWAFQKGYISITDPNINSKILNPAVMHLDPNFLFFLELFIFVAAMFALWIVVTKMHRKNFKSIITSAPKIRWKRFALTAAIWMMLCFVSQFIAMQMDPGNFTYVFNLQPFLLTLLIGVIFLPIQTWWEEFFFRGYLYQGIGLKTKTALVPIIITGFIFAGIHMFNPEVAAYGALNMFPAYLIPGIFLGMMAALDEGLESAMGMHFANNLFGTIAVTSSDSAIQANTIWRAKTMNPFSDNLTLLFAFILLMGILSYTNKWNFSKLYR
jgi:hypothetical protein